MLLPLFLSLSLLLLSFMGVVEGFSLVPSSLMIQSHPATFSQVATSSWSSRTPSSIIRRRISNRDDDDDDEEEEEVASTPTTTTANSPPSFEELGLCREALDAVSAQEGWFEPTPIQQLAIPRLLLSRDDDDPSSSSSSEAMDSIWCEAPTGSGKTAAFVLPLLQRLLLQPSAKSKTTTTTTNTATKERQDSSTPTIRSLILCPTRELATQIGSVVTDLSKSMMMTMSKRKTFNALVITGGTRREDQLVQLADWAARGESVDVVIATPGRLVDVLTRYTSSEEKAKDEALERRILQAMQHTNHLSYDQIQTLNLDRDDDEGRTKLSSLLEGLEYLVLDEADRLLARAFEEDMDAVLDLLKPENRAASQNNNSHKEVVQTWLFSATFPKLIEPRVDTVLKRLGLASTVRISCANSDRIAADAEEISATLQKRLERIQNNQDATTTQSKKQTSIAQIGPASTIQLRTIRLEKRDRTQALKNLLQEHEDEWSKGGVLVFVATRYASEHVSRKLRRAGIRSAEVHGKLDQDARERRLSDLQSGKIHVLLTTDLTSRGIDLKDLSAVINYDLPRSTADFVHRVGRTGRAGRSGTAITFVTPATEMHMELIERRHLPEPTPREVLPGLEVDEDAWQIQADSARMRTPGAGESVETLAFDRMHGGIKGKRKSKKDRLREQAVKEATATTIRTEQSARKQ